MKGAVNGILALSIAVGSAVRANELPARIDAAIDKALRFMVDRRDVGGQWRSETYGCFRDDPALATLILSSIVHYADRPEVGAVVNDGVGYLVSLARDRRDRPTLVFPVYTAAASSWLIGMRPVFDPDGLAKRAWLDRLRRMQLGSQLGWRPEDPQFGGWGYATVVPRRPDTADASLIPYESNISATLFGLGALRLARVPMDDPIYGEIATFVERCQNFGAANRFDDGGFFFGPTDNARNKAGVAGTDDTGKTRYESYGSATADGLRALLLLGLATDHPRVMAAADWLTTRFDADSNPGRFADDREVLRDATYYYYCWSVAHAFMALNTNTVVETPGPVDWPTTLAGELIARQRSDGSWANRFTDAKEDDPLVATPLATAALTICRFMMRSAEGGGKPSAGSRPPL